MDLFWSRNTFSGTFMASWTPTQSQGTPVRLVALLAPGKGWQPQFWETPRRPNKVRWTWCRAKSFT